MQKKVIYLSSGNFPSISANSIQTMKMAQAFSKLVPSFELVTLAHRQIISGRSIGNLEDYWQLYGIQSPFTLIEVPRFLKDRYHLWSVIYARLKYPDFVFTRSFYTAGYALHLGVKVLVEAHEPELSERMKRLIHHPRKGKYFLGIVTISPQLVDFFQNNDIPKEKITMLPDAVDLGQFQRMLSKNLSLNLE